MSVAPEASTVKNSLAAHAAVGLLAGALLYIVCLAGTVLVFYDEWQRIEQPAVEMQSIAPEAAQRAAEAVMATEAGKPRTTHLYFALPTEFMPRATVYTDTQSIRVAPDGKLLEPVKTDWATFLYALHYELTMQGEIGGLLGITIVGALGAMMLALSISGVIAHPRIFRDAFRLRARDGGGVGLADWHNRLSVWTLPFIVAISLTGAVIGLGTLVIYGVAERWYGGDTETAYAPVFGGEGKIDKTSSPLADFTGPLAYMKAHYPDIEVSDVTIHDPMTKGSHVQLIGQHPHRLIFGEYYNFDAAGNFLGKTGLSDGEWGQQAAASNYNLHFGNYGGYPVKIAYFLLGLALTAICATGTYIWLGKRRRRGHDEPKLHAAWDAVVWGTPFALAMTLVARFTIGNTAWFGTIFWSLSLAILALSIALAGRTSFKRPLQGALVAALAGAGVLTALP